MATHPTTMLRLLWIALEVAAAFVYPAPPLVVAACSLLKPERALISLTRARGLAAAGVMTVAALAGGCSSVADDGPIRMSTEPSRVCAPLPEYHHAAFGVNLPESLPDGVTIDDVALLDAENIEVTSTHLMEVSKSLRLLLDTYPPVNQFPDAWKSATPTSDEVVPTSAPVDLVLELVTSSPSEASLSGVRFSYTVSGRKYQAQSSVGVKLSSSSPGCD